ncbi:hypothetical protein OAC89_01315 [Deltaproteobacteria bacterium]|nr:hypothetical protein [Deltaproteobacteria bacterium]
MKHIFEMRTASNIGEKDQTGISIGINVKIGGKETLCPISGVCDSPDGLESEIREIYENLEDILARAKKVFNASSGKKALELQPDLEPKDLWEILSSMDDEKGFIDTFNNLDQEKRKEIAEYILTRCNIFSGKGAVFSSLYNNETGMLA